MAVKAFEPNAFLIMATKQGTIKKTTLDAYSNPRKGGIIAITLEKGDALIEARITDGKQELLLITRQGKAIRCPEAQVRGVGRSARGVRGMRLGKGDEVIAMAIVRPKADLLTVTALGFGKRSALEEYRSQSRGGKGIINIKVTAKNGPVVGAKTVTDQDEVMLITQEGMMVRSPVKDVRQTGRAAQGVRLIHIRGKDRVASVAAVVPKKLEEPEALLASTPSVEGAPHETAVAPKASPEQPAVAKPAARATPRASAKKPAAKPAPKPKARKAAPRKKR